MKVLAIIRPPEGTDVRTAVASHAVEELHELWKLYRNGTVREMYLPDGPGAILIVEAESTATVRSVLGRLPLLAEGVMALEVTELRPFAALQVLFAGGQA